MTWDDGEEGLLDVAVSMFVLIVLLVVVTLLLTLPGWRGE